MATSSWPVGCTDQAAWLDSALDAKHPWSRQDNMLAESSARAGTREWVAQYVRESGGELDDGLIQAGEHRLSLLLFLCACLLLIVLVLAGFCKLLERMMCFNCSNRATVAELLDDAFFIS